MIPLSLTQISTLFLFICYVNSFPNGAPLHTCGSMTPGHHGMDIREISPFELRVTPKLERNLNVEIWSPSVEDHFKGFLIEARYNVNNQSEAIGTWSTNVKRTKTLNCFGLPHSAVTHHLKDDDDDDEDDDDDDEDDNNKKHHHKKHFHNISFTWFPPSDIGDRTVHFIVTIVKHYAQVYKNVKSSYEWNDSEEVRTARFHAWLETFNSHNRRDVKRHRNNETFVMMNETVSNLNASDSSIVKMGRLVVDKMKKLYSSAVNKTESFIE